jgi:signal transduction histidine kinase
VGIVLFLLSFSIGNIIEVLSLDWGIGQYGLFGAPIFVAFLAYLIVRYKAFNAHLIEAEALIAGIAVSIISLLFIRDIVHVRIIAGITFALVCFLGFRFTRSVKREIEQSERLSIANKSLEAANKWKESIIHAMNHQIKGYLATARNIFSELLGTDYGQIPEQSKPLVTHGFEEMGKGVGYVQGILKSMSAQSGMLSYSMKPVDLKSLFSNLVAEQKDAAEQAGLSFSSTIADDEYTISGDAAMLEEAFKNLITNAILYNNPHGGITVTLSRTGQKILFAVKDTGVGISKDDQERLFKPGGMGKDSIKHNANASGYGLALVEPVVKEHQGKIWYETEVGKGTTFFVELPVTQQKESPAVSANHSV